MLRSMRRVPTSICKVDSEAAALSGVAAFRVARIRVEASDVEGLQCGSYFSATGPFKEGHS